MYSELSTGIKVMIISIALVFVTTISVVFYYYWGGTTDDAEGDVTSTITSISKEDLKEGSFSNREVILNDLKSLDVRPDGIVIVSNEYKVACYGNQATVTQEGRLLNTSSCSDSITRTGVTNPNEFLGHKYITASDKSSPHYIHEDALYKTYSIVDEGGAVKGTLYILQQ